MLIILLAEWLPRTWQRTLNAPYIPLQLEEDESLSANWNNSGIEVVFSDYCTKPVGKVRMSDAKQESIGKICLFSKYFQ